MDEQHYNVQTFVHKCRQNSQQLCKKSVKITKCLKTSYVIIYRLQWLVKESILLCNQLKLRPNWGWIQISPQDPTKMLKAEENKKKVPISANLEIKEVYFW